MERLKNIKFIDIRPEMSVLDVSIKASLDVCAFIFAASAATYLANGYPGLAIFDASLGLTGMLGEIFVTRTAGRRRF